MKNFKKVVSFLLSLAMVLSIIVIPTTSNVSAAEDYTYFGADIFKYNTDVFNQATKAQEKTNGEQGIYFSDGGDYTYINGNVTNKDHNKFTGRWDANKDGRVTSEDDYYTVKKIVNSQLTSDGKIQFNYPEAGIFDTSKSTGKNTYTNVQIPFKQDDKGYYYFDTASYDVRFSKLNNNSVVPNSGDTLVEKSGNPSGFYPFNTESQDDSSSTRTYHFGMNMGVSFYMTPNGRIGGTETGAPIRFEFSGDDDVWVFVDGKLVLDIGGIHRAISGTIDFAEGKAYVYEGQKSNVVTTTNLNNILGTNWNNDPDKEHTLQVFYLERGKGESNCKIRFNLPQRDKLEVAKILGNTGATDEDLSALGQQSFEFQLLTSTTKEGTYTPCKGMKYKLYEGTSKIGEGVINENGTFNLAFNQRALFDQYEELKQGNYYKVVELKSDSDRYTPSWSSTINGSANILRDANGNPIAQIIEKKDTDNKINNYIFACTNTYEASATDDLVVLDYGKKVTIDVLSNDVLLGARKIIGDIDKTKCTNGELEKSENNSKLVYEPKKFMNSIDEASYKVLINNVNNPYEVSANVKILPATSVYYEDDFGTENNGDSSVAIVWSEGWGTDGQSQTGETQSSENSKYGWDDSYSDDKTYSNGSAHYSSTKGATATFTFKGTGVDVYSRTKGDVGLIRAQLYKSGSKSAMKVLYIDNISESGDYYQIPTLSFENLDYGTYTVKITVMPAVENNDGTTRGMYYLDGIRIYNPLKGNSVAEDAYEQAGESNAQYIKVRDYLLESGFGKDDENKDGAVFIDKVDSTGVLVGTKDDYTKYGPKNEVYLAKGQAIAFQIKDYNKLQNVFVGLKVIKGDTMTTVEITDKTSKSTETVNSTSDLYYVVNPTDDGKVVIKNTGDNLLSITKLRVTNSTVSTQLTTTQELISYVSEFNSLSIKEDSTDNEDYILDKDDVDIENPDQDSASNEEDNKQSIINSIWKQVINSINKWFKR